jgi:hypothetical protein
MGNDAEISYMCGVHLQISDVKLKQLLERVRIAGILLKKRKFDNECAVNCLQSECYNSRFARVLAGENARREGSPPVSGIGGSGINPINPQLRDKWYCHRL